MLTIDTIKPLHDWLITLRHQFHRYPETIFEEYKTTEMIIDALRTLSIPCKRMNKTGVTACINGKSPGKTAALRADIDGLAVTENTGLPFASQRTGYMHACGHDAHITMLLGAARILNETKDQWQGRVKLIFQPAEEKGLGAKEVIKEGLLDDVDAIFGLHVMPSLATGKVAVQEGTFFAGCGNFKITIDGKSCHASSPWDGADAVVCACATVMNLQSIVSRRNDARSPIVISVGTFQGGELHNTIPEHVSIDGMTRFFDDAIQAKLPVWMDQVIQGTCAAYGCTGHLSYEPGSNSVYNAPKMIKLIREPMHIALGSDVVTTMPEFMGSEDFAEYQEIIPSAFFAVGCRNEEKGCSYSLHSDHFRFDDDALAYGVMTHVSSALAYLGTSCKDIDLSI